MKIDKRIDAGRAGINIKRALAGSYRTVKYVYTAGHPVDDTGSIKICFRYAGDFGTPQFTEPQQANYCSVTTKAGCRLDVRWDLKANTRPWGHTLYIKVMAGFLDTGDRVSVTFGDRRQGSPGWQMQTFVEDTFEFKTLVDPVATYQYKELTESPVMRIVAGKPARAVCIAPSGVRAGEKFTYHLKLEDRWGNPTGRPKKIRHRGFKNPGMEYLQAKDGPTGLAAVSNPVTVADNAGDGYYWADFHGQSEETIGSNTIDQYFTFARDKGLIDICAHQGNDFQITDQFWKKVNDAARTFNIPGAFVTFPGYEWSGNTPLGGDRNVYFDSEGGAIARSCGDLLPEGATRYPHAPTAAHLFRQLRKSRRPRAFAFAHVGGRYPDMAMHDEKIEVAMEVHSAWGTFEWLVQDALARGYRVGICANSDGHKCRPGASYPGAGKFGSLGGLTCVRAEKLDRGSVAAAMRARRFYATTGNRSLVDVSVETVEGGKGTMGDVLHTRGDDALLRGTVSGTAPIEKMEVFHGGRLIKTFAPAANRKRSCRIKIVWRGAEVRGRARLVCWDGMLKVSGNTVKNIESINFWNPDRIPVLKKGGTVEWQSNTTGGLSGFIITLNKPDTGHMDFSSRQGNFKCSLKSFRKKTLRLGGIDKAIEAYRLPEAEGSRTMAVNYPRMPLTDGDNAVFMRVTQEDGHLAWTSPLYLVKR